MNALDVLRSKNVSHATMWTRIGIPGRGYVWEAKIAQVVDGGDPPEQMALIKVSEMKEAIDAIADLIEAAQAIDANAAFASYPERIALRAALARVGGAR